MVSSNGSKEELVKLWVFNSILLFLIFENISMNFDKNLKKKKEKRKKKKKKSPQLMAWYNWSLMEYQIDDNWKLEDWNDKTEVRGLKWKRLKVRESVLHFFHKNI